MTFTLNLSRGGNWGIDKSDFLNKICEASGWHDGGRLGGMDRQRWVSSTVAMEMDFTFLEHMAEGKDVHYEQKSLKDWALGNAWVFDCMSELDCVISFKSNLNPWCEQVAVKTKGTFVLGEEIYSYTVN